MDGNLHHWESGLCELSLNVAPLLSLIILCLSNWWRFCGLPARPSILIIGLSVCFMRCCLPVSWGKGLPIGQGLKADSQKHQASVSLDVGFLIVMWFLNPVGESWFWLGHPKNFLAKQNTTKTYLPTAVSDQYLRDRYYTALRCFTPHLCLILIKSILFL